MLPEVTDFYSSLALNDRLWAVIKAVGESPEKTKLDPVQKRFVDETLADFRNSGADLPPAQKQRVAEIEAELSKLTKEYSEHVLDSTNAWELIITDESKLAGLPDSAKAGAAANARAKGSDDSRVAVHPPVSLDVSDHAASARRRDPPPGLGGFIEGRCRRRVRQHRAWSGGFSNCATRRRKSSVTDISPT